MDAWLVGLFSGTSFDATAVPLEEFLIRLLVAWLVGQLIAWFYAGTHGVLSYSQNFTQALVLLSMVVCVIMGVVGDSLARAFGLGAALAIVRFRTPVKDARDTTFLFLAVAAGMAAGAGAIGVAIFGALGICGVAWLLHRSAFGTRSNTQGLLRFRYAGPPEARSELTELIGRYCSQVQLAARRAASLGDGEEFAYDIDLKDEGAGDELVDELNRRPGISGVTLIAQARAGEG